MRQERKPWSRRTWKAIALTLISLICAAALSAGGLLLYARWQDQRRNAEWADDCDPGNDGYYEPITTTMPGSWDSINQDVIRPEGWRRIVQNSEFLGIRYPVIDGSTTMVPLAMEFARQHLEVGDEQAKQYADFSTTGAAYEKLRSREIGLFIGTMPGQAELDSARASGIAYVVKPICRDSFVFITYKGNPVDSLTIEQIRGIFSGKITGWKDVGGADILIHPWQREPGAGSQTGMEKLVMQGTPMASDTAVPIVSSMGGLVEAVANTYGIGYTYSYYIENLYKNANVKVLRIDGAASADTDYPLRLERCGVIRQGEEQSPAGLFLDWILSEEGQACVAQAGYIPIDNAQ